MTARAKKKVPRPAEGPCPECGAEYPTFQGMAMHRSRMHGVNRRNGNVSGDRADAIFNHLARVTEALFPDGVPPERIMEVAEWQKATLKVMTR